jgi:hypothetical protein
MFLDDGDGIVFTGDTGPWYSPATKQCHLSREAAKKLLSGVLQTYEQLHGKELTEVFLHCRSTIDDEEWQGFRDACPENVSLVGIRVAPERRGLRGYRTGTRPVVRGTFWPLSARVGYLWASGFKPALRTYDGFDVPEPLRIEIQHGHADLQQVAQDIYAVLETSRLVGVLLAALLPDLSSRLLAQLGLAPCSAWQGQLQWGLLNPGQPLAEPSPILARLELEDPL